MSSNVGLTFSVGDTTLQFTISSEQEQLELVTLNIIFSVVTDKPVEFVKEAVEVRDLRIITHQFR